jgi:hypothetical protein
MRLVESAQKKRSEPLFSHLIARASALTPRVFTLNDARDVCVLLLQDLSGSSFPWQRVCLFVCFITAGPITKLFAWGEEESGGHVL